MPLNAWGNIIDPYTNSAIQSIIDAMQLFPRKLIEQALTKIGEIWNSFMEVPVVFPSDQLFSVLHHIQRFQAEVIKSCIQGTVHIQKYIDKLTELSIHLPILAPPSYLPSPPPSIVESIHPFNSAGATLPGSSSRTYRQWRCWKSQHSHFQEASTSSSSRR